MFPLECDRDQDDREGIDGGCGCRRSMAGMASGKATTTFRVTELEVTEAEFREMVIADIKENWGGLLNLDDAAEIAEAVVDAAAAFDVGTVLERRGDDLRPR